MANLIPGGSSGFYGAAQPSAAVPATNGFYSGMAPAAATPTTPGVDPTNGGYYSQLTPTTPTGTPATGTGPDSTTAGARIGAASIPSVSEGLGTVGALGTELTTPAQSTPGTSGGSSVAGFQTTPGTLPTATPVTDPSAGPATPGVLSGPGYGEAWEAANGNNLGAPSNSQTLYNEGVAATNPYYQNAMNVTNQNINSAEAARGEGNSGAALSEIGAADANLSGQQALAQENLAGQADSENTSQFTASSNAAIGAENQTNSRVNGAAAAYTNLSNDQSTMVDNFFQMAESGQLTSDMASIEAQLAASGVDAATAQAITNDLTSVAGAAIKAGSTPSK